MQDSELDAKSTNYYLVDWLDAVWETHPMKVNRLDARRRLVMPATFPPGAVVTIHLVDDETVLVKLANSSSQRMVMLLPDVRELPDDPEWQKVESRIVAYNKKRLALRSKPRT